MRRDSKQQSDCRDGERYSGDSRSAGHALSPLPVAYIESLSLRTRAPLRFGPLKAALRLGRLDETTCDGALNM